MSQQCAVTTYIEFPIFSGRFRKKDELNSKLKRIGISFNEMRNGHRKRQYTDSDHRTERID